MWLINTHNGYIDNSSLGGFCGSLHLSHCEAQTSASHSSNPTQPTKSTQDTRIANASAKESQKIKIPPIDINQYPALKAHLDLHWDKIAKRLDKGITPYNLRNCAYLPEFAKPKIVYSEIVREPQFYLDNGEFKFGAFYAEATSFILSGNESFESSLEYLLGILHSKLATFAFKSFYAGGGLGESGYRYKKAFLERLPIPKISKSQEYEFVELVKEIIQIKQDAAGDTQNNQMSATLVAHPSKADAYKILESKLDSMVYALYGLSSEEIAIIGGGAIYSLCAVACGRYPLKAA
nr:TaqI-like C-terminal specificity domain-containing protein [Helicobacter mustelae]